MSFDRTPILDKNFAIIDLDFIKSISLKDIYSFIAYCQTAQMASAGTRARKIVSIRQFWKKKYVIASGLNPAITSTHKLRHTAATLMYKYGRVDIRSLQQILGHESIARL